MLKTLLLTCLILYSPFDTIFAQDLNAEQIYSKIANAIVTIYTFDAHNNPIAQGSGVVLNESGWVVTNYHVYVGSEKLVVKHKEKVIKYTGIIGLDVEKDILILKIADHAFPPIAIGNSNILKVGQKVYAIGSPLGFENTITEGIISGLRSYEERTKNFIQISAAISPGSSGGAVVDSKGRLIAITTFTMTKGQNLNFAIPINEVLKVYKKAGVKPNELSAANYFYQGYAESNQKNFDAAINYYLKAIAINPESVSTLFNLANAYYSKGDTEEAITYYNKAILKNPIFSDSYYNLGHLYYRKGDMETAITLFKKAITINPKLAIAYYNLGVVYGKKGELETSINYYKEAIEINPEYADVYNNLGLTYAKKHDYETAIIYFKKVISIDPQYAKAYHSLSLIYGINGDDSMEKYYLEKAYQLDPSLRNK